MNVEVTAAGPDRRGLLAELLNLYLYDLSDLDGARELDEQGRYSYPWLDLYWTEDGRFAFVTRVDGAPAGFSLVNRETHAPADWTVAEFFVARRYRRRGVGTVAAHQTFERLRGRWEVWTDRDNLDAHAFWRRAVDSFTRGAFRQVPSGHGGGPTFLFESNGREHDAEGDH